MNPRSTSRGDPVVDQDDTPRRIRHASALEPGSMTMTEFQRERDRGCLSVDHLLHAVTDRVRDLAHLNAVTFLNERELARGPRPGPLSGIPILVKDNIDTSDAPTTAGTPALDGRVPGDDAVVVANLRRAGATIAGKCSQDELCLGAGGYSPLSGMTRNPLDVSRTTGGSSSGAAAAVAAGIVPAALGSDTLGSIRIPASFCGIFGFRPSVGRYSSQGLVPVSGSRDTPGPLARSMDDVLLLDSVLSDGPLVQPDTAPSEVCLGVNPEHLADLDGEVRDAMHQVFRKLESAGVTLREVALGDLEREGDTLGFVLAANEFAPAMREYLATHYPGLSVDELIDGVGGEDVKIFVEFLRGPGDDDTYRATLRRRQEVLDDVRRRMDEQGVVAMLHPTSPRMPGAFDAPRDPEAESYLAAAYIGYIRFATLAGALAVPALSVPFYGDGGEFPVGVELRGRRGEDDSVLRSGAAVSTVLG